MPSHTLGPIVFLQFFQVLPHPIQFALLFNFLIDLLLLLFSYVSLLSHLSLYQSLPVHILSMLVFYRSSLLAAVFFDVSVLILFRYFALSYCAARISLSICHLFVFSILRFLPPFFL